MAKETIEELKNLVDEERFEEAVALLPQVKERNAKTVSEMMALAKMYGKTGDWERSEKLYLKAYKKRQSRLVLKDIMMMFIETGKANEAENYYNQYIDLTPGDTVTKLFAKYKIEKIRGTEVGYLINLLKQLKETDYTEEYGYELCKQYYKANEEDSCRKECAELIENFPDSVEAEKAKRLIAVMNGEISADEIKKKSGLSSDKTPAVTPTEIRTKDLPTIEFSEENEANEETERTIASSVQDIISEEATQEEAQPEPEDFRIDPSEVQAIAQEETQEAVPEVTPEAAQEAAPTESKECEAVPVRIYAEVFTPTCVLGKEDFADTKARNIITEKKVNVEAIFGQFFRNISLRRQIYNCLELAFIDKGNTLVMISGEEKTGRTYFGKKLIFCMYSMGIIAGKKVAVTKASVINRLTPEELLEKTAGSNIIVEKAGGLTEKGLATLTGIKADKNQKICVILEDTDSALATFIKNLLSEKKIINNRIHIPKYNTEDLLGFVYDYVSEQGYGLEKVAADLVVSCINSTRAGEQGERYMHALKVARQSVATADERIAPEVLKMAAEAAFQEYYSLTIIREDITP